MGSTYVQNPPYFEGMYDRPGRRSPTSSRPASWACSGQHHHRPHLAGRLDQGDGPAGVYLIDHQVPPSEFNSYGARRGNHEVMMRGTFANIRIRNRITPARRAG